MKNNLIPRIVEIVGPAGAGKTTLCQALNHSSAFIQLSNFPNIRQISAAPFFFGNGFQVFARFLNFPLTFTQKINRREFAWLSILNGWPAVLEKELRSNKIIILDQGPIYLLTEIREFGSDYLRQGKADILWQDLYSRWSDTLNLIVWLDAEDTDLLKRIRSRDKDHIIKNESMESTFEFLARYRSAYEVTLSSLEKVHADLKILRFNTSSMPPQEIADQLLLEFTSNR